MNDSATVIRMTGYGEQHLIDAIHTGMLSADAQRAYSRVLSEVNRLRKENRELKRQIEIIESTRKRDRRDRIEAYRMVLEKESDYRRARDWRVATYIGLASFGGIIVAIATVIAIL